MNAIKEYMVYDNFAKFILEGKEDYSSLLRNLTEIQNRCLQNKHHKVIIVKRLDGQLTMRETYRLFKEISQLFYDKKLAIVDQFATKNFVLNDFGESVFLSTGVLGKLFYNEQDAEKWLL